MDLPAPPQHLPDRARDRETTESQATLTHDELSRINACWRAAKHLSYNRANCNHAPLRGAFGADKKAA